MEQILIPSLEYSQYPDDIGEDMEVAYRDSRDAAGSAVQWFATSTIGSTTGTISLDRQVYPVPFGISGVSSAQA